jgi:hypothetical protein
MRANQVVIHSVSEDNAMNANRPRSRTLFRRSSLVALIVVLSSPWASAANGAPTDSSDLPPRPTAAAAPTATVSDAAPTPTAPSPTAPTDVVELKVYPSDVHLSSLRDRQSMVAQVTRADGLTEDVTSQVTWLVENEGVARWADGILEPVADGQTQLTARLGDLSATAALTVTAATSDPPISFKLDVVPVFMKAGCNSGACHGAARGKDGFRLSLFGFDPAGDYYRLTREMTGRRINLAMPEECLLVCKATGQVSHTGGSPIKAGSPLHETLLRWLEAGAPNDPGEVPTVERVELFPPQAVLNGEGTTQRLTVRARYSDGTDRDVTSLAYFMTSNDNSAKIDQTGQVTAAQRGEAFIMARFETHTVGVPFVVLPKDLAFTWRDVPQFNYVDALVDEKLRKLRIQPSELCDDREFVRRVYLDICGIVPTVEETQAFVADTAPDKRAKLIDELLERKEFVELWVMKWAELLQIRSSQQVSYKAALLYYNWLQEQIASNTPIDQMVRELLSAQGGTFTNAATNFYQNELDPLKISENVAQVFMGMRIQCAQCHNHPFDRWTMDDYYGFAAFFAQIGRKGSSDPRETIVFNRSGGEINHPLDGRAMPPKFLGGAVPELKGRDRRAVLADWLASSDNPYFATNLANIVWAHFLGRGIVHEVDDVRVSNPACNQPLLDELGKRFTESGYDFKQLVRDICNSRTYQLSTLANETNQLDDRNFSRSLLRRIRAEILLDVISQVTETQNKFPGLSAGARAVQIADGSTSNYFLTTFGRATRESVCSCEVKMEPSLSQALHLINGETVHTRIQQGGVVARLLEQGQTPDAVLDQLYWRCLARPPTDEERQAVAAEITAVGDAKVVLEDAFWVLLNSREFVFNH